MANIKQFEGRCEQCKADGNSARTCREHGGPAYTLTLDEIEIMMVRAALRAYRHKLVGELADHLEDTGGIPNDPDEANLREWIDRVAQFKSDLGDS